MAKTPSKSAAKSTKKSTEGKRRRKKRTETFGSYVYKVGEGGGAAALVGALTPRRSSSRCTRMWASAAAPCEADVAERSRGARGD